MPEVSSQADPTEEFDGKQVTNNPVGDDMRRAIQKIIADLLTKNDKLFYKLPSSDQIYKLRDQGINSVQSNQEFASPPAQEYPKDNFAPAPIASTHHSVRSPQPRPEQSPYDQSLTPTRYNKPRNHHQVNQPNAVMASPSEGRTVSKNFDTEYVGMNRRNNKYYYDNFKHNLGSGMKSFASYVKVCLNEVFPFCLLKYTFSYFKQL